MSSLPRFRYVHTLDDEDLVNGREGTLYHATRLRSLKSFKKTGVNPIPHGNFYSGAPSFNLADTVEQAVSHVLHGRPSARIDGSPTDPIMVLAFRMELQSIFNGKTAYVSMEPVGEFLGAEDAAWVADNFDREGLDAIESVPWDFVVGPFLTPVKQSSGEVRYKISKSWTESGAQLVHVAAVSREAFTLLNRSLVGIFVETETKSET
ncbi:hypothetical protein C8R44DRAFT_869740 [Mycena epipterygia]|nr:hypothetical protein C8R44DRAFT_869740 [Mycena epipterygia]